MSHQSNQILGGMFSSIFNTAGQLLIDEARSKAAMMREENLARFKQQLTDESSESGLVDSYGYKMNKKEAANYLNTMTADEEAPRTAKDFEKGQEESRTWMRKNEQGNYEPITNREADDIIAGNKARKQIAEEQERRGFEKAKGLLDAGVRQSNAGPNSEIGQAQKPTFDEQATLDSWADDTGELVRVADIEARKKHLEKLEEKAADQQARVAEAEKQRQFLAAEHELNRQSNEANSRMAHAGSMGAADRDRKRDLNRDAEDRTRQWNELVKTKRATPEDYQAMAEARTAAGLTPLPVSSSLAQKWESDAKATEAAANKELFEATKAEIKQERGPFSWVTDHEINTRIAEKRANNQVGGVDKSRPVSKDGVVGYRQKDGSVLSADGRRLN